MFINADPIDIKAALASVVNYWTPKVVGQVNDQYIKVAKLKGELVWHSHLLEDEMFWVIYGTLKIELEDRVVVLKPGSFYTIPKNVRHNPIAEDECGIVLIETVTALHTGEEIVPGTVAIEKQLNPAVM
jgi:mannose-6-phosphate isomerase-like protein (cupin superfamily)